MIDALFVALFLSTSVPDAATPVKMGPGDLPMGTFCRVEDVCVIAQTEGDCGKIRGKTFSSLEACQSAASAAVPQQDK